MTPGNRDELRVKHDGLASMRNLDPALGGLASIVSMALSAEWRRFDEDRRRERSRDPLLDLH